MKIKLNLDGYKLHRSAMGIYKSESYLSTFPLQNTTSIHLLSTDTIDKSHLPK